MQGASRPAKRTVFHSTYRLLLFRRVHKTKETCPVFFSFAVQLDLGDTRWYFAMQSYFWNAK